MSSPSPDLVDGLVQLSFAVHAALARIAAAHDLSIVQLRLFGILRDREPGMLELARYLALEKSSLTGLVDRAEARGLVDRIPSPADRRATSIRLSVRGRKLTRLVEGEVRSAIDALLTSVPDGERKHLTTLIWRLIPTAPEI